MENHRDSEDVWHFVTRCNAPQGMNQLLKRVILTKTCYFVTQTLLRPGVTCLFQHWCLKKKNTIFVPPVPQVEINMALKAEVRSEHNMKTRKVSGVFHMESQLWGGNLLNHLLFIVYRDKFLLTFFQNCIVRIVIFCYFLHCLVKIWLNEVTVCSLVTQIIIYCDKFLSMIRLLMHHCHDKFLLMNVFQNRIARIVIFSIVCSKHD